MRRRPGTPLLLLATAMALHAACGKRADPLAPYVKTPLPPAGLDVSQIGDEVEVRIMAPTTTTEKRPLPVIQLEWLQGPPTGDFNKAATSLLREDVAPGEVRLKRFPRPPAQVRYTVRAFNGKARSTPVGLVTFTPAPIPPPPTGLVVTNTANGVELRWNNPPGAEPWPTPSTSPSPSPSPNTPGAPPTPGATPSASTVAPSPTPTAAPSPAPTPTPPAGPAVAQANAVVASPSPLTTPKPTPTPPTGIRIFRTDGAPRLAREPLQAATWLDPLPKPGEKPCYALRYATSFKPLVESASTESVCADVKDIVPPDPPGRLVADIGSTFVELSWLASPSADVAFYRVYRALDTAARAVAIETQGPVLRIRDPNMTRGPRAYDVVAVDKAGNESAPGVAVRVVVP